MGWVRVYDKCGGDDEGDGEKGCCYKWIIG